MAKTAPKAKAASAVTTKTKAGKPVESKGIKEAPKPVKKAVAKAAAKPAPKTAAAAAKPAKARPAKARKGDRLYCEVCGLAVSVDETCGCAEACDIICCGREMQPKK
jgi:type IV secretory pathway VirB10-like protein